ncbi:MAG: (2Fe-2S)-binding protein [Tannerella sp.]|jgi:NADH dehydrogenase/NADH:ubiquinone oxidoreductase subunit G|nr:(2Fe-2S)-binding protein [Tannerella sp.]
MKIKIDGQEIEAEEGERLIDIAARAGIHIPSLCYAPGFKHQSSCMVCMVRNLGNHQILTSCSTFATDGMDIDASSDDIKDLRKASLELLFSDHMAVCKEPCNVKECKLRLVGIEHRAKWNRHTRYSGVKKVEIQHIRDNLYFDVSKCFRCGLCVYNSNNGFTFKNRGFGMEVVLPKENYGNVDESHAALCPAQAIYVYPLPEGAKPGESKVSEVLKAEN